MSTISGHLTRLREAKLLTVEHDGRPRCYRLAGTDVARALEEPARIARPLPVRSLRDGARTGAAARPAVEWLRRGRARRVVQLTEAGRTGLHETVGAPVGWDDPPAEAAQQAR